MGQLMRVVVFDMRLKNFWILNRLESGPVSKARGMAFCGDGNFALCVAIFPGIAKAVSTEFLLSFRRSVACR